MVRIGGGYLGVTFRPVRELIDIGLVPEATPNQACRRSMLIIISARNGVDVV
jgi:hypothetical protein